MYVKFRHSCSVSWVKQLFTNVLPNIERIRRANLRNTNSKSVLVWAYIKTWHSYVFFSNWITRICHQCQLCIFVNFINVKTMWWSEQTRFHFTKLKILKQIIQFVLSNVTFYGMAMNSRLDSRKLNDLHVSSLLDFGFYLPVPIPKFYLKSFHTVIQLY